MPAVAVHLKFIPSCRRKPLFATSAGLLAFHVVDLGKQGVWQHQWRRRVSCGCAPDVI